MKNCICLLYFLFLMCQNGISQNSLQQAEFWMDKDYTNKQSFSYTNNDFDSTINLSNYSAGLHEICIRFQQSNGQWSAVQSQKFIVPTSLSLFEYWIDRDYANRQTQSLSTESISANINVSNLASGMHEICYRVKQNDGKWSVVDEQSFYVSPTITLSEYWFDDNFLSRLTDSASAILSGINIPITNLPVGLHTFYSRTKQNNGTWSQVIAQDFFKSTSCNEYEYWFDKNYSGRIHEVLAAPVSEINLSQLVNASALSGLHQFHFRSKQSDGKWSSVYSQLFNAAEKIVAYEVWFNQDYSSRQLVPVAAATLFQQDPLLDVSATPLGSNTVFLRWQNQQGKWSQVITAGFCHNDGDSAITLKLLLQGYYLGNGLMAEVLQNQGMPTATAICDSIDVELHNTNSPYALVSSVRAPLQTNGIAKCYFPPSMTGQFYLAVKHRNTIETWSAFPIFKGSCPTSYDFTTSATKAYAANQVLLDNGRWGLYTGDVNQDENIDLLDIAELEGQISNFVFGYVACDLNGDGNVDLLDQPMLEANIGNFVFSAHP